MDKHRCAWVTDDPVYISYHDEEWGHTKDSHDDRYLFEMLSLEGSQAGLSWITILKRRENYRKAFDQFNPHIVAFYDEQKVQQLMQNEGIIRNKLKIKSVIQNARAILNIQEKYRSFSEYIWQFVDGQSILNDWQSNDQVPSQTKESEKMSKDLKAHGFSFVGPVICYSFMQATGMVNDHTMDCFLYHKNFR